MSACRCRASDVPIAQIKRAPALLGETDVLKTHPASAGRIGRLRGHGRTVRARAARPIRTSSYWTACPVYNVSHVLGLFTVFNADAVKTVTLMKGGFPARYGGRLSSFVLEINMRDGDADEWSGEGGIGMHAQSPHAQRPDRQEDPRARERAPHLRRPHRRSSRAHRRATGRDELETDAGNSTSSTLTPRSATPRPRAHALPQRLPRG